MSNVIRHKRGTSNPAAGDFSNTGELLVNTSDGGVFTKTDGNSVVEIGSNASNLSTGTVPSGRLSGSYGINVTGSSASCTGNANTATTLQTARTIGGVSFNGSANINLPGVNTTGNQNTSGSSASCTGNAASATVLQTARTINGTSFNGSANITITANTSNTLSRGSYLTGSNFNGSAATTWAVDATTDATGSKIVARTSAGDIYGRYLLGSYMNMSHSQSTRSSDTIFYSSTDAYIRKNTASGFRSSLSVPHLAGNNTFTLAQRGQVDALTSASTITPNFNNSNNFSISLSTNTTIANPSNLTAGQSGAIAITYNGSYTVAFGSYWKFAGGTAPTATSTSGKVDVLVYYVESSTRISAQLLLNMGG